MVSETLIEELQQILKKDYKKDFKRNELIEVANSLVGYFSLLAKIDAREKLKNQNSDNDKNTNN